MRDESFLVWYEAVLIFSSLLHISCNYLQLVPRPITSFSDTIPTHENIPPIDKHNHLTDPLLLFDAWCLKVSSHVKYIFTALIIVIRDGKHIEKSI